jgi:hypothetical protein
VVAIRQPNREYALVIRDAGVLTETCLACRAVWFDGGYQPEVKQKLTAMLAELQPQVIRRPLISLIYPVLQPCFDSHVAICLRLWLSVVLGCQTIPCDGSAQSRAIHRIPYAPAVSFTFAVEQCGVRCVVLGQIWSTGCDGGAGDPTSTQWCPATADTTLQWFDLWFYIPLMPVRDLATLIQVRLFFT